VSYHIAVHCVVGGCDVQEGDDWEVVHEIVLAGGLVKGTMTGTGNHIGLDLELAHEGGADWQG
jgi:hypothetical protein